MRIGWVISANKARKNRWSEFQELGRARGFVVAERPFSLEDDAEGLEEQAQALLGGLPDVVIAKFTDHLQRANAPDSSAMFGRETREKAQRQLRLWSEFQSRHPSIVVLDSPEAQTHVLDRGSLSALLASLVNTCQLPPFSLPVASPKFVSLSLLFLLLHSYVDFSNLFFSDFFRLFFQLYQICDCKK